LIVAGVDRSKDLTFLTAFHLVKASEALGILSWLQPF